MTDFIKWLYIHYIKPEVDAVPQGDHGFHFDLLKNQLTPTLQAELDTCLEFTAVHAFLLGMRTGAGLSPYIPAGPSEAGPSGSKAPSVTPQ